MASNRGSRLYAVYYSCSPSRNAQALSQPTHTQQEDHMKHENTSALRRSRHAATPQSTTRSIHGPQALDQEDPRRSRPRADRQAREKVAEMRTGSPERNANSQNCSRRARSWRLSSSNLNHRSPLFMPAPFVTGIYQGGSPWSTRSGATEAVAHQLGAGGVDNLVANAEPYCDYQTTAYRTHESGHHRCALKRSTTSFARKKAPYRRLPNRLRRRVTCASSPQSNLRLDHYRGHLPSPVSFFALLTLASRFSLGLKCLCAFRGWIAILDALPRREAARRQSAGQAGQSVDRRCRDCWRSPGLMFSPTSAATCSRNNPGRASTCGRHRRRRATPKRRQEFLWLAARLLRGRNRAPLA